MSDDLTPPIDPLFGLELLTFDDEEIIFTTSPPSFLQSQPTPTSTSSASSSSSSASPASMTSDQIICPLHDRTPLPLTYTKRADIIRYLATQQVMNGFRPSSEPKSTVARTDWKAFESSVKSKPIFESEKRLLRQQFICNMRAINSTDDIESALIHFGCICPKTSETTNKRPRTNAASPTTRCYDGYPGCTDLAEPGEAVCERCKLLSEHHRKLQNYDSLGRDMAYYHPGEGDLMPGDIVGVLNGTVSKDTSKGRQLSVVPQRPGTKWGTAGPGKVLVAYHGQVNVQVKMVEGLSLRKQQYYVVPSGNHDGKGLLVTKKDLKASPDPRVVGALNSDPFNEGDVDRTAEYLTVCIRVLFENAPPVPASDSFVTYRSPVELLQVARETGAQPSSSTSSASSSWFDTILNDRINFNIIAVGSQPKQRYLPVSFEEHNEDGSFCFTTQKTDFYQTEREAKEAIFTEAQTVLLRPAPASEQAKLGFPEEITVCHQRELLKAVQERYGMGVQIKVDMHALVFENAMIFGASQVNVLRSDNIPLFHFETFVPTVHQTAEACISASSELAYQQLLSPSEHENEELEPSPPIFKAVSLPLTPCSPLSPPNPVVQIPLKQQITSTPTPTPKPTPTKIAPDVTASPAITDMDLRLGRARLQERARQEYGSNVALNVSIVIEGDDHSPWFGASQCQIVESTTQVAFHTFKTPVACEYRKKRDAENASCALALKEWAAVSTAASKQAPIGSMNYKSKLQQRAQKEFGATVILDIEFIVGGEHSSLFGARLCTIVHPATNSVLRLFKTPVPCKYSRKKDAENACCALVLQQLDSE